MNGISIWVQNTFKFYCFHRLPFTQLLLMKRVLKSQTHRQVIAGQTMDEEVHWEQPNVVFGLV
jgi:hypothetical protein